TFLRQLDFPAKVSNVNLTRWPAQTTGRAIIENHDSASFSGIVVTDSSNFVISHLSLKGFNSNNKNFDAIHLVATSATSEATGHAKPHGDQVKDCEIQGYGGSGIAVLARQHSDYQV